MHSHKDQTKLNFLMFEDLPLQTKILDFDVLFLSSFLV